MLHANNAIEWRYVTNAIIAHNLEMPYILKFTYHIKLWKLLLFDNFFSLFFVSLKKVFFTLLRMLYLKLRM